MGRTTTLPKRLQPMLATLTDKPFDDDEWVFEDKYDGFRMVAEIEGGRVTLYSRNGKIISDSYIEVAKALEGVKSDAVIDGELVALDENGVSHFQLLQNALRHKARLLYCASCSRTATICAASCCSNAKSVRSCWRWVHIQDAGGAVRQAREAEIPEISVPRQGQG
jgi:hypothetical protein